MPTLLLELGSRRDQVNFRPDRHLKTSGSSLAGTILAGRYRVLETIDVDSLKAHDLALDQTVIVRKELRTSPHDIDIWRQKVRQLTSIRNASFLNVIDLVSEKSGDFVITEYSHGQSLADLLKEQSCFDPQDVLALVTPLGGALDLAASFACPANSISARWLFAETRRSFAENSLSGLLPFFVKVDVWELVRPRKDTEWPFPASKGKSGNPRGLVVKKAALLTYELLGGERKSRERSKLKRWFKPVSGLGDAGNAILYRGLQGSPPFESSTGFFQKLKLAIPSAKGRMRTRRADGSPGREQALVVPSPQKVIRKFDRDTILLAIGVFGVLVFAILLLAICLFIFVSVLHSF
jgi:hypothetical protein